MEKLFIHLQTFASVNSGPNAGGNGTVEYLAIGGGGGGAGRFSWWRWCWCRVPGSTPISVSFSHSVTIGAGGRGGYLGNDPAPRREVKK